MAIDISAKPIVNREAIAEGTIKLKPDTITKIKNNLIEKGNVVELARVAAIHGVKNTTQMLVFCHPIPIYWVNCQIDIVEQSITVRVHVRTQAKTGCEMEALMGVSNGLLQIWDMVKMYEKDENGQYPETVIDNIKVIKKIKKNQ